MRSPGCRRDGRWSKSLLQSTGRQASELPAVQGPQCMGQTAWAQQCMHIWAACAWQHALSQAWLLGCCPVWGQVLKLPRPAPTAVPPALRPKLHFYNTPAVFNASSPENPLNILRSVYKPGDFVVGAGWAGCARMLPPPSGRPASVRAQGRP